MEKTTVPMIITGMKKEMHEGEEVLIFDAIDYVGKKFQITQKEEKNENN